MTETLLVMTRLGLADYLQWVSSTGDATPDRSAQISSDAYLEVSSELVCVINRRDSEGDPILIAPLSALAGVYEAGGLSTLERLVARLDRVSRAAADPPLTLPPQWRKYQHNNLLAFFALPRSVNDASLRWVTELLDGGSVCFWHLTSSDAEIQLADYIPDSARLRGIGDARRDLFARRSQLLGLPSSPVAARLQPLVDLSAVGSTSVTKGRTYSAWLPELTPEQIRVLEHVANEPLKVRGPAGSGKTLTLELRALSTAYSDRSAGRDSRIAFLTHSWALAQQVDDALHALDETGEVARTIDVMPLLAVRELIHGPLPEGIDLLGEDSLDGKKEQLRLISDSIDAVKTSDWNTYRDVAPRLVQGVAAEPASPDRLRLCFDLMREFVEVMDPNQIKPGFNSLAKYIDIRRQAWMVELPTRGSLEFVFGVYREYVSRLVEEGQLTTDQVLDDFRRYLESYTWNLRREEEGYDLILIDEFHLFNDAERHILHLLTRDPDAYPPLIMAMDPRQSAFALLTGLTSADKTQDRLPGLAAKDPSSVELTVTHRFTPEIHEFVSYLHKSFPNLVSLGEDWEIEIGPSGRDANRQADVEVKIFASEESLIGYALELAIRLNSRGDTDERVAVIGIGTADLDRISAHLRTADAKLPIVLIESREDVDLLRYSKKSVIVTGAEYAAGLQFSTVIAVSTNRDADAGSSASSGRVALSQLYLATSRASDVLLLACIRGEAGVPHILQGAVDAGAARLAP